MNHKQRVKKLKGALMIIKGMNAKPNLAALGREYQMDWRTVKKYYEGYEGKTGKRNKKASWTTTDQKLQTSLRLKELQ